MNEWSWMDWETIKCNEAGLSPALHFRSAPDLDKWMNEWANESLKFINEWLDKSMNECVKWNAMTGMHGMHGMESLET